MEYVKGYVKGPLDGPHPIAKVAYNSALDYITAAHSMQMVRGILAATETENLSFDDEAQMKSWFSSRLFPGEGRVSFRDCDLALCYLDIAPRNIDRRICVVDRASAGLYPRIFEFWAQWKIEGMEGSLNTQFLQSMKYLPSHGSVH